MDVGIIKLKTASFHYCDKEVEQYNQKKAWLDYKLVTGTKMTEQHNL